MADGKTVEEVAREITSALEDALFRSEGIAKALRKREQETAAECIRIARNEHVSVIDLVVDHQPVSKGPFTIQDEATKSCADSIVKAILSRFPKAEG